MEKTIRSIFKELRCGAAEWIELKVWRCGVNWIEGVALRSELNWRCGAAEWIELKVWRCGVNLIEGVALRSELNWRCGAAEWIELKVWRCGVNWIRSVNVVVAVFFQIRWWTFGLHKRRATSWSSELPSPSQEEIYWMELLVCETKLEITEVIWTVNEETWLERKCKAKN